MEKKNILKLIRILEVILKELQGTTKVERKSYAKRKIKKDSFHGR